RRTPRSPLFPYTTLFRSVHLLEVVQVEQQERAAKPVASAMGDVALELLLEAAPVEQARERVVVGHVAKPLLDRLALGIPVAGLSDVDAGGDHVVDPAPRAGHPTDRPLD